MAAADRAEAKIDTREISAFAMAVPYPTDKFGRSTARQSRNGTVDQRSSAIDAGPARVPPRCGRRQCNPDTSLDDEWIVRIGHARRRIRAAEIPPQCRSE